MTKTALRFFLLILLIAPQALAGYTKDVLNSWRGRMGEARSLLEQGEYHDALRISNKLIREMVERLGPGDGSSELFGIVLTYKALAHAGLNDSRDALWYWQLVRSLYPKLAGNDWSSCGAPAEFLKQNGELAPPESTKDLSNAQITPPSVTKKIRPKYPEGAQAFGVSGPLIVEVVITRDGRIISPRIVQALPAPTLSFAALEALKKWQVEPAKANGEPVDVVFQLTVNYKP